MRDEWKRPLVGFFWLLGSGLFASLGFVLLASDLFPVIEQKVVVQFLVFAQWQVLGVTVAKLGVDNVVFAAVSREPDVTFEMVKFAFFRAVPIALLFSIFIYVLFGFEFSVACFVTVVVDFFSVMMISDRNARAAYGITSIANLLNYPLFFLSIFLMSFLFDGFNLELMLAVFIFSSVARLVWLVCTDIERSKLSQKMVSVSFSVGVQQVLNYAIFKLDQIILGVLFVGFLSRFDGLSFASDFLFLAKMVELITGVFLVAGIIIFPKIAIEKSAGFRGWWGLIKNYYLLIVFVYACVAAVFYFYAALFRDGIGLYELIPFLFQSFLVFPVNLMTFSMIRDGYILGLIKNLFLSVVVGCLFFGFVFLVDMNIARDALAWFVVVQLAIFLMLGVVGGWGERVRLYG